MNRNGSYESAPATALVATHCCICGRALVEAESIASGIGPVCAEKTGFGRLGLEPSVREEVNRLVYRLAALQRSPEAVPVLQRLRQLGFVELVERIEERLDGLVELRIDSIEGVGLVVATLPWLGDAEFQRYVAGMRSIEGRRWRKVDGYRGKVDVIPDTVVARRAFYRLLSAVMPGRVAKSAKGMFLVPELSGGAS